MHSFLALPIYLLLLILPGSILADAVATEPIRAPKLTSRLPKLVRRVHASAAKRTHSLARDLRVAFGHLIPRDVDDEYNKRPVVYCKAGGQTVLQNPNDDSGDDGGNEPESNPEGGNSTGGGSSATAARPSSTRTSSRPPQSSPTSSSTSSPWGLTNSYAGTSFLDGWTFFTSADPTHGIVDYIDEQGGRDAGILAFNDGGNLIMRVESTPTVPANRRSIRITTEAQFNGGLVIMDAVHMPVGCGTWPAFWTNGPNWPAGGEIDILEAVHDYTHNQATLHTSEGCTIASTSSRELGISGNVIHGTNCDVGATDNQGCGIRSDTPLSYGRGFNANGGGVYAMRWDTAGIAIYFFPRGSIPADIDAEQPQPDNWGPAQARWPAAACDPFRFFKDHHIIFDTTLCGDWAGGVWNSGGIPGQEQSCAQRTGFATCEEYVRRNGDAFRDAYWEVRSVKLYQLRN
ncbi:endo-1,3(4)-beta-glucanase [Coprinopsis sp. MPI-PUGE-AT-0042]|nr:endo-1,3(4)-beta-glucanase [Coprinopsis sp. MPI-PUGE-AT-0042]